MQIANCKRTSNLHLKTTLKDSYPIKKCKLQIQTLYNLKISSINIFLHISYLSNIHNIDYINYSTAVMLRENIPQVFPYYRFTLNYFEILY